MNRIALVACCAALAASPFVPALGAELTGSEVFAHYCSYCHAGTDGPGTEQLRRTRGADKALLVQRSDLAPDYIEYVVRHGLKSMPPFVPSDLTDARIKALTQFLTSPLPRR